MDPEMLHSPFSLKLASVYVCELWTFPNEKSKSATYTESKLGQKRNVSWVFGIKSNYFIMDQWSQYMDVLLLII